MEPLAALSRNLRIERLQPLADNRRQDPPFRQGQNVRGLIVGREGDRFVLEINGERYTATAAAPLRIGQRLDLTVTATQPRVVLQLPDDPVTGRLNRSLHLLSDPVPPGRRISNLAQSLPKTGLSPSIAQVIEESADLTGSRRSTQADPGSMTAQRLLSFLGEALRLQSSNRPLSPEIGQEMAALLKSLPDDGGTGRFPERATLLHLAGELENGPALFETGQARDPSLADRVRNLLEQIALNPLLTDTAIRLGQDIIPLLDRGETPSLLLLHLLDTIGRLSEGRNPTPDQRPPTPDGRELQELPHRLGLAMERMLADNRTEEAGRSLKAVLLDLQSSAEDPHIREQARQIASTLELYQLLQHRLAQENLLFFPLPLSFLDQGFLLVQPDQEQSDRETLKSPSASCTLLLSLEGLGDLRIDLSMEDKGLRLRFHAQDRERARFLADNREQLHDHITTTPLESVQFLTGAQDPARTVLDGIRKSGQGMLDTRI